MGLQRGDRPIGEAAWLIALLGTGRADLTAARTEMQPFGDLLAQLLHQLVMAAACLLSSVRPE